MAMFGAAALMEKTGSILTGTVSGNRFDLYWNCF
jgi:hypothetical protein